MNSRGVSDEPRERRTPDVARIEGALAGSGLMCRGGFHPKPEDGVPGEPATLVMIGNAGPGFWPAFEAARRDEPDPMNAWARRILTAAATALGAEALFPFDGPPYLPFQRWAQRADAVHPSPIGPLIHPDFGLWHAYRGAFAFRHAITLPLGDRRPAPCETCADKPCLTTCPVEAFRVGDYDVPRCVDHIVDAAGSECLEAGCLARRACPVGREYTYAPAQAHFHMAHFLCAQRPS